MSDPFAYTPVTTPESASLIMTGNEIYDAGRTQAQTGDGLFEDRSLAHR